LRTGALDNAAPQRLGHPIVIGMNAAPDGGPDLAGELPILVEGDPQLRRVAQPVAAGDAGLAATIARMAATLAGFRHRHGFGRALAAPQLGIAKRVIVVDLGAGPFAVVNPEIEWRSAEMFEVWDDCFSVPDKVVRVRRHRSISLRYRDAQLRARQWSRLAPPRSGWRAPTSTPPRTPRATGRRATTPRWWSTGSPPRCPRAPGRSPASCSGPATRSTP
jgi:peptide deformylase